MGGIYYNSPVGILKIISDGEYLTEVSFVQTAQQCEPDAITQQCVAQLEEYFAGKRKTFDIPMRLEGTNFRKRVWAALAKIPYAQTMSYGELARAIGNSKAMRAVGGANHNNPISIIIPCHRVIGANGSLVGYGGGLEKKEYLLALEQEHSK